MGRKKAREAVIKILYQKEIVKTNLIELAEQYFIENDVEESDREFVRFQIEGINKNITEIDQTIKKHLKTWDFDRLSKPDLAILRNAVFEIIYRDDISESVAINEAVLLCKRYGTDDSFVYVNGILGNIVRNRGI